jgi:hypothetical protein
MRTEVPNEEQLVLGSDVTEAAEFMKSTGMGRALLKDADTPTVARVTEGMGAALEPSLTTEGVRLGSKSWLVTARRPVRGAR